MARSGMAKANSDALLEAWVFRAWLWRREAQWASGVTFAYAVVAANVGSSVANVSFWVLVIAVAVVGVARSWVTKAMVASRQQRRWERALVACLGRRLAPKVVSVNAERLGSTASPANSAWVRVRAGSTVKQLDDASEALAAYLGAMAVRVSRHPRHAGLAQLVAMALDPLSSPSPAWPWSGAAFTDLWLPIPVGVGEDGAVVSVSLPEHNVLLGGEPGAGKSNALSLLVAAAALDPKATLWLLDGKLVELSAWRGSARAFAGVEVSEATEVLNQVRSIMDDRYRELLEHRARKVGPAHGLHVVVCDELAHYLSCSDKKARDAFVDALRDLVSRGRAAGIVVLAATQKPASDVVPTSLRDLFGFRWALRCSTSAASDTILGSGWATQGYSASSVEPSWRGIGYLLHESGVPLRMRSFRLDDRAIEVLSHRAEELRRHHTREGTAHGISGRG